MKHHQQFEQCDVLRNLLASEHLNDLQNLDHHHVPHEQSVPKKKTKLLQSEKKTYPIKQKIATSNYE
jgi:hypothetical protein